MRFFKRRDLIIIPIVYLLFGLYLFANQYNFLYHPHPHTLSDCSNTANLDLITTDTWNGYYAGDSDSDTIIIFYHGNAGNACQRTSLLPTLTEDNNYSVLFVSYPGFAAEDSPPTTARILASIPDINSFVVDAGYQQVISVGESIGGGFASYHATVNDNVRLVLIAPFAQLSDRVQEIIRIYPARILLKTDLRVAQWAQAAVDVSIIAAEYDSVIPRRHTDQVRDALTANLATYKIITNTDHNSLYRSTDFHHALTQIINASEITQ